MLDTALAYVAVPGFVSSSTLLLSPSVLELNASAQPENDANIQSGHQHLRYATCICLQCECSGLKRHDSVKMLLHFVAVSAWSSTASLIYTVSDTNVKILMFSPFSKS